MMVDGKWKMLYGFETVRLEDNYKLTRPVWRKTDYNIQEKFLAFNLRRMTAKPNDN
jgi:hypothetical protein